MIFGAKSGATRASVTVGNPDSFLETGCLGWQNFTTLLGTPVLSLGGFSNRNPEQEDRKLFVRAL